MRRRPLADQETIFCNRIMAGGSVCIELAGHHGECTHTATLAPVTREDRQAANV